MRPVNLDAKNRVPAGEPVSDAKPDASVKVKSRLADRIDHLRGRGEPGTTTPAERRTGGPLHAALLVLDEARDAIDRMRQLWRAGKVNEKELVNTHEFTSSNKVDLLVDGTEFFPAMMDDVANATKSINVSFYIFSNDELGRQFADLLIQKAKEGVEVNVMVDGIGSMQLPLPFNPYRKIIDRLKEGGVKVLRNHLIDWERFGKPSGQLLNHPDHRKLVIVDGRIAYTGGLNVAEHYMTEYHDLGVRIEGPAVRQMQCEWLSSWMHIGGSIPCKTDADFDGNYFPALERRAGEARAKVIQAIPGQHREIFDTYLQLIRNAEFSIHIENPYCTNPEIQQALVDAAKRGVKVHVILPGQSDHGFSHLAARSKYPEMMAAGVNIYEYPGFNHGKVMVVDNKEVTIGSSNLDDVALRHIYELNLVIQDTGFAMDCMERIFDVDLAKARRMTVEEITGLQKLTGAFFNLFSSVI